MAFIDYNWTAPFTGNVIIEAWGSGAGGYLGGFGAGGGGAYARSAAIAIVATTVYNVRIGSGGTPNNNGDESNFGPGAIPNAVGGKASNLGAGGLGGLAGDCTGDVAFSGGDGAASVTVIGGGGGGSGGDGVSGNVGGLPTGAAPVYRGGGGGDGGTGGGDGDPGFGPGGGGGASGTLGAAGGPGGRGALVIWRDLGVWPPTGQSPIAVFGDAPVNFAKSRKGGFIM